VALQKAAMTMKPAMTTNTFRVRDRVRVQGVGCRVWGVGCRVYGLNSGLGLGMGQGFVLGLRHRYNGLDRVVVIKHAYSCLYMHLIHLCICICIGISMSFFAVVIRRVV
jgi:hypothetical protein